MIQIKQQSVYISLPCLVSLGEEFNLPTDLFTPDAVGKVVEVIGQSSGRTRVKMEIIQGRPLPRRQRQQAQGQLEPQQAGPDPRVVSERERFRTGTQIMEEGDEPVFGNLDPRPRQGSNNQVVESSPIEGQTEQQTVLSQIFTNPRQGDVWKPRAEETEAPTSTRKKRRSTYENAYERDAEGNLRRNS